MMGLKIDVQYGEWYNKIAFYKIDFIDFYSKYIKLKIDGTSMGIKCK